MFHSKGGGGRGRGEVRGGGGCRLLRGEESEVEGVRGVGVEVE